MNRNKWQGIACLLLASLMVGSTFAAPMRNENPTPRPTAPSQTAVPTTTPRPMTGPSQTPRPTMAPSAPVAPSTKPSQTSKPYAPKPTTPQGTVAPQAPTCPPCPPQKPCPPEKPCPAQKPCPPQKPCPAPTTVAPSQTTKPCAPVKPDKNKVEQNKGQQAKPCKDKVEQNKVDEAKPDKHKKESKSDCGTTNQKPFMLDHFKMIVVTLKKMGVEEKQIVTHIKEGKKLEDILQKENIKPKKFKRCIIKEYNKAIDEAQKSGQITCEQSKQLKAAVKETIKNWLPNK